MMNATMNTLMRAAASDDELAILCAVAVRAGLLWHCAACDHHNPGRNCSRCAATTPDDTSRLLTPSVIPVVSAFTGIAVSVYDDEHDAAAMVEKINTLRGAPILGMGPGMAHNPQLDDVLLLEHLAERATGKA